MKATGLTQLTIEQLERLLRALHRDQLEFPLEMSVLMVVGFSDIADRVDTLRGLDRAGVKAVLVAVIAERRLAGTRRIAVAPRD